MNPSRRRFGSAFFFTTLMLCMPSILAADFLKQGVAAGLDERGDVVLWSRGAHSGTLQFQLHRLYSPVVEDQGLVQVDLDTDYTGKWRTRVLQPGGAYSYSVSGIDHHLGSDRINGRFRMRPRSFTPQPVSFAWGADVAGQNICRSADEGFPIFSAIAAASPDFFIGAGDMIYADSQCNSVSRYGDPQIPGPQVPASDLTGFRDHWRYVREDAGLQKLLASTLYLPIWDDHEVVNDFGPLDDTRDRPPYQSDVHLMPLGLQALFEYNPIIPHQNAPDRLYRAVRWGQHLEVFILDTRQYRDRNSAPDSVANPKTMLGRGQLEWLKSGLAGSDATWKIIVSSVPLAIPTAFSPGRQPDAWANGDRSGGYEHELLEIVQFAHSHKVRNMLWLSGDVHMGAVFRYHPIETDPDYVFHEAISGPLHARVFGSRRMDPTLRPERLFLHAPANPKDIRSYSQARQWWNFGFVQINQGGYLRLSLRNVSGEVIYTLALSPFTDTSAE